MKIAFIRSIEIQQSLPSLSRIQKLMPHHTGKLFYTDGICENTWFSGDSHKIDENLTCDEIVSVLLEWNPDVVISISLPDNNSMRDALIKEKLRDKNIPMIMHPIDATNILCNKWDTISFLRNNNYPVSNSFLISGDLLSKRSIEYLSYKEMIINKANGMKFPLIVKPLWDSMSLGILKLSTIEDFSSWLDKNAPDTDIIVEEFLNGELFGMEVVGCSGSYYCQPLIQKCTSKKDNDFVPFDHIRFGPVTNEKFNIQKLEKQMTLIAESLGLLGSAEFEMIFYEEEFYIIEINPRVSGLTNLSSTISNNNIYDQLIDIATGNWNPPTKNTYIFTAEVPLINLNNELKNELEKEDKIFSINEVVYHDGSSQAKMLIKGNSIENIYSKLKKISDDYLVIDSNVLKELEMVL